MTEPAYRPHPVWSYPLVSVFAPDKATADQIAGPGRLDTDAHLTTLLDATAAKLRLGVHRNPAALAAMDRGDGDGAHERRRAQRMQDPEFRESYDRERGNQ